MTENYAEPLILTFEPDEELAPTDAVLLDVAEVRGCKVATSVKHAAFGRYAGQTACLLVFEFDFLPGYHVRFKHAEIAVRVLKPKPAGASRGAGNTSAAAASGAADTAAAAAAAAAAVAAAAATTAPAPAIIAHDPKSWHGRREQKTIRYGIQAGASVGALTRNVAGADSGPALAGARSVEYSEGSRASIVSMPGAAVTEWRLTENELASEGIPSPFNAALIVKCSGAFAVRVSFRVKLSKSLNPASWRAAQARTTDLLTFDTITVGSGIGPQLGLLDRMEDDQFSLGALVRQDWDL